MQLNTWSFRVREKELKGHDKEKPKNGIERVEKTVFGRVDHMLKRSKERKKKPKNLKSI